MVCSNSNARSSMSPVETVTTRMSQLVCPKVLVLTNVGTCMTVFYVNFLEGGVSKISFVKAIVYEAIHVNVVRLGLYPLFSLI
jgi:hypothetical protein